MKHEMELKYKHTTEIFFLGRGADVIVKIILSDKLNDD